MATHLTWPSCCHVLWVRAWLHPRSLAKLSQALHPGSSQSPCPVSWYWLPRIELPWCWSWVQTVPAQNMPAMIWNGRTMLSNYILFAALHLPFYRGENKVQRWETDSLSPTDAISSSMFKRFLWQSAYQPSLSFPSCRTQPKSKLWPQTLLITYFPTPASPTQLGLGSMQIRLSYQELLRSYQEKYQEEHQACLQQGARSSPCCHQWHSLTVRIRTI